MTCSINLGEFSGWFVVFNYWHRLVKERLNSLLDSFFSVVDSLAFFGLLQAPFNHCFLGDIVKKNLANIEPILFKEFGLIDCSGKSFDQEFRCIIFLQIILQ